MTFLVERFIWKIVLDDPHKNDVAMSLGLKNKNIAEIRLSTESRRLRHVKLYGKVVVKKPFIKKSFLILFVRRLRVLSSKNLKKYYFLIKEIQASLELMAETTVDDFKTKDMARNMLFLH